MEIISLKDKSTGELNGIAAPCNNKDDRVLILWRVSSGFRGGAGILADESVTVIAFDKSWHSGRGNLGETAEILAVLKPGQSLYASISGRRVQNTNGILTYNGEGFNIIFGGEELNSAISNKVEGDYL